MASTSVQIISWTAVFYILCTLLLGLIPASYGECSTTGDPSSVGIPEETGVTSFIGGAWNAIVFMTTIGFAGCVGIPSIIGLFFLIPHTLFLIGIIMFLRGL